VGWVGALEYSQVRIPFRKTHMNIQTIQTTRASKDISRKTIPQNRLPLAFAIAPIIMDLAAAQDLFLALVPDLAPGRAAGEHRNSSDGCACLFHPNYNIGET